VGTALIVPALFDWTAQLVGKGANGSFSKVEGPLKLSRPSLAHCIDPLPTRREPGLPRCDAAVQMNGVLRARPANPVPLLTPT
jgi:hypothetical protein